MQEREPSEPINEPAAAVDSGFYQRADAHISLANGQISAEVGKGKVSASQMYAAARFNAWVSASSFENVWELEEAREEIMAYFLNEYQQALRDNLEDYINHFNTYLRPPDA